MHPASIYKLLLAALLLLFSATAFAVDTDGDGVDDSVDAFPNDPLYSVDADHDTLPDNWEVTHGRDPNIADYAINDNCTKDENGGSCTPATNLTPRVYQHTVDGLRCNLFSRDWTDYSYTPSASGVTATSTFYYYTPAGGGYCSGPTIESSSSNVLADGLVQFYSSAYAFCFLDRKGKHCYSYNGTLTPVTSTMVIDSDGDGILRPTDLDDLDNHNPIISTTKNDYNNDGIAGWIWKGQSNGVETQSQIWQLTFPLLSANFGVPNRFYPPPFADQANWELLTSGDFNKDGDADIVWRNNSTAQWKVWQMQNGTRVAQNDLADFDLGHAWQVIGAGDTDKDGDDDIILNSSSTGYVMIWEMQNHAIVNTHTVGAKPGYVLNRIGDFNKDGDMDLLFREIDADVLATWEIENNLFVQERALANTGTGYNPVCAGDFDNDGDDDIMLVNSATLQEKWFEIEVYARLSQKFGATNTGFSFMGCGDYDGDGDADMLWHRSADDANRVVLQQNYGVTKQTVYTNPFGGANGFVYRGNSN